MVLAFQVISVRVNQTHAMEGVLVRSTITPSPVSALVIAQGTDAKEGCRKMICVFQCLTEIRLLNCYP